MDTSTMVTAERSPLDLIRQAEAEAIRRVVAARKAADQTLAVAQAQAADLKRQAAQTGQRDGQAQYQEIISQAEQEARVILAQARNQAQHLRQNGNLRMDDAVCRAVAIIIGQETGRIAHEP